MTMQNSNLENYQLAGKELEIYKYPHPVLAAVAKNVEPEEFNDELKELCLNMLYTMYRAPGIGLAAPQIGISKRIFVIDVDFEREELDEDDEREPALTNFNPYIFINPIIRAPKGERIYQEGCLSLPGIYEDVLRADTVSLEYQDLTGKQHKLVCDGLLSTCVQHENDHLDGIVFIEHLSTLKKNFFKKKLVKAKKRIET